MEPWLDSLSDEWASNRQSSSPANSNRTPRSGTSSRASAYSQSRIPHLSQHSQTSKNGSFLRPRSARGLARAKTTPVLAEQNSSKLNVVAHKANADGPSTIPRRTSGALSGTLNSVQHFTIQHRSGVGDENIPEWKRRLARGEGIGDGCDLFGPTRLEGIFKPPAPSHDGQQVEIFKGDDKMTEELAEEWSSFGVAITQIANESRKAAVSTQDSLNEESMTREPAEELSSFGLGITQVVNESRKPSVTTQDFLNEAAKIMQIIRERGLPKSRLSSIEEPEEEAQVSPNSILDLEVEGEDTTVDNFSRPPSRNGTVKSRRDRMPVQDPRVVSHLQKYQDADDLDLLITSKLDSLHLFHEPEAEDAALVPLPDDDHEDEEENVSSPANIRIRESIEQQRKRKRKRSTSTIEGPPSLPTGVSSGMSTSATIPTCSSASSGNKGRIPPGLVSVPDQVGVMTFDHSTKSWVRGKGASPSSRKTNSEEDPFGDIPDLSIDEQKEKQRQELPPTQVETPEENQGAPTTEPGPSSRPQTREGAQIFASETATGETKLTRLDSSMPVAETRATSWATVDLQFGSKAQAKQHEHKEEAIDHDEEVEHEIRIHDGRVSEVGDSPQRSSKKARAVTITFSSPLVSAIAYHNEHSLPEINYSALSNGFDDDVDGSSPIKTRSTLKRPDPSTHEKQGPPTSSRMFVGRPVSRIVEQDEDRADYDMSVVHISQLNVMTPGQDSRLTRPTPNGKGASMISLTPLSEFTLHQTDRPCHLEASYVAERAHPNSLQQAHGSLALAVDELMKAITDAEPDELYWEHIRRLDLRDKRLTTLHSLDEYCSAVEELHVSGNEIRQLSGVPVSVRSLLAQNNCLSTLTSWGHLQNLQYLDVSGNELESLDGLGCLAHLREIKANNNQIRNLDGILDLDGVLHLALLGNELTVVDFEGAALTRLHHLDLSRNQLTSVRNINALPALQTLHLEKNRLSDFGAANKAYPMLRDLRLSFNQIEVIDLGSVPSIEVLYLDNNCIRSVRGLETARHLNTLSLREQSDSPDLLSTILGTSNECRKLYLSSNPAPPGGLKMAPLPHLNLKYLELGSCGLTTLPPDFGEKIPNCRTLNLNFNAIHSLRPLRDCGRLNKLMVAGNRLSKLRRTCMVLTMLPALIKIDLRDNPLTVGFYPPFRESRIVVHGEVATDVQDPYSLPPVDQAFDRKWITHLDEGTRMKRRTIELFLAEGCEKLIELDGLAFDRVALLQQDEIWSKLTSIGVLAKTSSIAMVPEEQDEDEALPLDAGVEGV